MRRGNCRKYYLGEDRLPSLKVSFTAEFAPLSVRTFRISKGKAVPTDFLEVIV
ncbi:MAG: hypothetical protein K5756_07090 [Clostridiales bacterium]|nr:hypothetical protein [Clostridiales bacterium]